VRNGQPLQNAQFNFGQNTSDVGHALENLE
jgi:hypothetical protein